MSRIVTLAKVIATIVVIASILWIGSFIWETRDVSPNTPPTFPEKYSWTVIGGVSNSERDGLKGPFGVQVGPDEFGFSARWEGTNGFYRVDVYGWAPSDVAFITGIRGNEYADNYVASGINGKRQQAWLPLNCIGRYRWESVPNVEDGRSVISACGLHDGTVIIVDGYSRDNRALQAADRIVLEVVYQLAITPKEI